MALTLRLNDIETQELDKIKAQMNVKTASQAIAKLIMEYNNLVKCNNEQRNKLTRIEGEKASLHLNIHKYLSALEDLKNAVNK